MSRLDLIAGPNGAGKTTLFRRIINRERPGLPFVNADDIASVRFPGQELERAREAAAIAARTRDALIDARIDFCTEMVFSHRSKIELIRQAHDAGYHVSLHVVMVPLTTSRDRVAARVENGGHAVPEAELPTRYERLWPLLANAAPRCGTAVFYDNTTGDGPTGVATFRYGIADQPPVWPDWTPAPLLEL